MARRKLPPGTKEKVLAEVAAGKKPEQAAIDHGISVSTVQKWAKDSKTSLSTPSTDSPQVPEPVQSPAGAPLADILAKHPSPPILPAGSPPTPTAENPAPMGPPPKPMEVKELMAVVITLKATVIQAAAMAYKVKLVPKEAEELAAFTESEKTALEALAPYAAEYTASAGKYVKPILAAAFIGTVGFSTARSVKALQGMRPSKGKPTPKPESKGKPTPKAVEAPK